jgi:hypothetical protein
MRPSRDETICYALGCPKTYLDKPLYYINTSATNLLPQAMAESTESNICLAHQRNGIDEVNGAACESMTDEFSNRGRTNLDDQNRLFRIDASWTDLDNENRLFGNSSVTDLDNENTFFRTDTPEMEGFAI